MGWFRSRVRLGAWLALAALALNLAVAFGHHHFDEISAAAHAGSAHADHSEPTDRDDDHHDPAVAHPCLICLVVTAAATAAGGLPALPPRDATPVAAVAMSVAVGPASNGRTSFEARAPPTA